MREWTYVANDKSTFMSPATTRLNVAWFKPLTIENRWADPEKIAIWQQKKTFLVLDNVAMVFFPDVPKNDFSNKQAQ